MTIYYGTDGNDKIDGNTLANDINFIDAKKGDDVVILKNGQKNALAMPLMKRNSAVPTHVYSKHRQKQMKLCAE